jgi:hypothetical protein
LRRGVDVEYRIQGEKSGKIRYFRAAARTGDDKIMKNVFLTYNEELHTVVMETKDMKMNVTETEHSWDKYMVVTNTGIRKVINGSWDFDNQIQDRLTCYLFKMAQGYFELLNALKSDEEAALVSENDEYTSTEIIPEKEPEL